MQAVLSQIDVLETTLIEEKRKSRRHLWLLSGAYAALIVWTIWDTATVFAQIKRVSAPEQVAALAAAQVSQQLPGLQRDMVTHFQQTSPQIAARLLQSAHQAIPATGQQIKQELSAAAEQLAGRMDQQTPALTAFVKAQLKDSLTSAQYASNEALNTALVDETLKALDQALQQALEPGLLGGLVSIQADIDQLSGKATAELDSQQRAEKAALLNALRLSELARSGGNSSLLAQGVRALLQASLPTEMFQALDSPMRP